jgi:dephospho-CoA kinase
MIDRPSGTSPEQPPLMIGITGPIGCGKSTVARMLADVGGAVIDADVLARRATERGRATLPRIRERFGNGVFQESGELDRAALAAIAFADPAALADLEAIVHPEVRVLVEEQLNATTTREAPFVVVEAIKLVQGGLSDRCDEVWLIECDPASQRERLLARGSETVVDLERRIAAQGSDLVDRLESELRERATAAVDDQVIRRVSTAGSLDEVRERIEEMLADALQRGFRI